METKDKIITFIKAVEKQHYKSFIEEGQICFNTIKWFRDFESRDSNIGDEFEGASMSCGSDFKVYFGDPIENYKSEEELKKKIDEIEWSEPLLGGINLKMINEDIQANIFSLYTIKLSEINSNSQKSFVLGKFAEEFNNHRFILFLKPDEFISRINGEINKLGRQMQKGLVKYYPLNDKLIDGLTIFNKPDKYSFQNEFRIAFEDKNATQKILRIGNISELCFEIDIKKNYRIEHDDNNFSIITV